MTYLSYLHYKDSDNLSNTQVFNKKSLSYLQIYFVMYQSLTELKKLPILTDEQPPQSNMIISNHRIFQDIPSMR